MRIDAYHAIHQVYQASKVNSKALNPQKKAESDSLEISDFGKVYQTAKKAVADAPEVREDKIQMIQAQMANGTYQVSREQLADRMADRILGL